MKNCTVQKLAISVLFVILANFMIPHYVTAKSYIAEAGGKLLNPICELLIFVGDCVIDALQTNFLTEQRAIVQANSKEERKGISGWTIVKIAGGVLGVAAGVAITVVSFGTLSGAGAAVAGGGITAIASTLPVIGGAIAKIAGGVAIVAAGGASAIWGGNDVVEGLSGEFDLPMIAYTPFAIFSNVIPVFDINFFSPNEETEGSFSLGEEEKQVEFNGKSSASILRQTVASWYVALRALAIVGLLSVLVYIGIRMLLSSVAQEKAKYKAMLFNWIIAMCLIFTLHYIMAFTIHLVEMITTMLAGQSQETILVKLPKDTKVNGETLEEDSDTGYPIWAMSFVGYARLIAGGYSDYDTMQSIEFTIIYLVLVIYTVIFTVVYLKRVLYMAFLTLIAPVIALTYPIDKLNDGKAQGFDTWLKEYIFNALIQPIHLLIYTVVVGTVMSLAVEHPIYALVALGFIIPAEKLLRRMFGFEKAQTPATLSTVGAAGMTMLMSGMNKLSHRPSKQGADKQEKEKQKDRTIRMQTNDDFNPLQQVASGTLDGPNSSTSEGVVSSKTDSASSESRQANPFIHKEKENIERTRLPLQEDTAESRINPVLSSQQGTNRINRKHKANTPKPKRKVNSKIKQGMLAVGERYSRKMNHVHPLRSLRKGLTYAAGGAALGMVGLAAGIASGDLKNVAQYTGAATTIGGAAGMKIGDNVVKETKENAAAFQKGFLGTDYPEYQKKKQTAEMLADYDNLQYLRERFPEYKEVMKNVVPEYLKYNVNDIEDIAAGYELEKEGMSRKEAIATAKLAAKTGDLETSPKAKKDWQEKFQKEFEGSSFTEEQKKVRQENIEKEYQEKMRQIKEGKQKNKKQEIEKLKKQKQDYIENLERHTSKVLSDKVIRNIGRFYEKKNG